MSAELTKGVTMWVATIAVGGLYTFPHINVEIRTSRDKGVQIGDPWRHDGRCLVHVYGCSLGSLMIQNEQRQQQDDYLSQAFG